MTFFLNNLLLIDTIIMTCEDHWGIKTNYVSLEINRQSFNHISQVQGGQKNAVTQLNPFIAMHECTLHHTLGYEKFELI